MLASAAHILKLRLVNKGTIQSCVDMKMQYHANNKGLKNKGTE